MITIPNGFDELMIAPPREPGSRFRILHVGTFYGSRQPDLLLEALSDLRHLDIEFVQLGPAFPSYETFRHSVRITLLPPMPRTDALDVMQTASLLYLKQGDEGAGHMYTPVAAKTYEYLATGIPVLAECPPGDNAALVERYSVGGHVVTSPTRAALRDIVGDAYARRNSAPPMVHPEFAGSFNRRSLTGRLAAALDDVASASA
jgi:glycosyltransferase involved in cell wall biosynthesis